jgi:hypothetical protein
MTTDMARALARWHGRAGRDPRAEAQKLLMCAEYSAALAVALEHPTPDTVLAVDYWAQEVAEVAAPRLGRLSGDDVPGRLRARAERLAGDAHALAAAADDELARERAA